MTKDPVLVIENARVFDGVSEKLLERTLYIVDGRFQESLPADSAVRIIDAQGRTVIPGMIDAHTHAYSFTGDAERVESWPDSYAAIVASRRLGAAVRRGFTTVRDVAGGDIGLSHAIDEGYCVGPRYFFTGPALAQTGGSGDPRSAEDKRPFSKGRTVEIVDGPDALRVAVRDRLRAGAHAIKLRLSGSVLASRFPLRVPQYSEEEVRATADEATRLGSYVSAHAYSAEAIMHGVTNGVRCIEHGNLMDAETARSMATFGAVLVPTLATYEANARRSAELGLSAAEVARNADVLEAGALAVGLAYEAGVLVGFGTDLVGSLEDEQLNGLRLHVEISGILETLRAVTSSNATILNEPDLGRISAGAHGDLVMLDGDPFTDPEILWSQDRPRLVVKGGREIGVAP